MNEELRAAHQQLALQGSPQPAPRPHPQDPPAEMVASVGKRMQSMMKAAEADADEVRRKAEADAVRLEKATQMQVAELVMQRDALLGDLARLRAEVEEVAAGVSVDRSPAPPPHADSVPSTAAPAQPRAAPLFEPPPHLQVDQPEPEPPAAPIESTETLTAAATASPDVHATAADAEATVQLQADPPRQPAGQPAEDADGDDPTGLISSSTPMDGPAPEPTTSPASPNAPNAPNAPNGTSVASGADASEPGQSSPHRSHAG
jgi:syndecan 1